jgi:hypothetical protein
MRSGGQPQVVAVILISGGGHRAHPLVENHMEFEPQFEQFIFDNWTSNCGQTQELLLLLKIAGLWQLAHSVSEIRT